MSGGGGGSTQKTDWTPQQRDYIESVTQFADDTTLPYLEKTFDAYKTYPGAYTGERVAPLSDSEQWATDLLGRNADQTAGGYDELLGGGGFGLDAAVANHPELIDKLYNPQVEKVIDATMADMADTYGEEQAKLGDSFGNAWGGSRAGVAAGKLAGDYTRAVGTVGSQMRKDAFDTASGLAAKDLDRWQTGIGLQNDALKGQAGSNVAAGNALAQAGLNARAVNQANNDVGYQNFLEQRDWGWNALGKANAATPGNLPGMSQANITTGAGGDPSRMATAAQGAAGGAMSGMAMGAAAGSTIGPGYGTLIGAGIGAIGGYAASDERLKTDLEEVGSLPIFNYRFLDEPPGTVHTGPMAQDVAQVMPDAVTQTEDGTLAIQPFQMAGGRLANDPSLRRLAQQYGLGDMEQNRGPAQPPAPGPDGLTGVQMAPMGEPDADNAGGAPDGDADDYDPTAPRFAPGPGPGMAPMGLSPELLDLVAKLRQAGVIPDGPLVAPGRFQNAADYGPTPDSAQRQRTPRPTPREVLPQFRGPQAPMPEAKPRAVDPQMGMTGGERMQRGSAPMPEAKPRGIAAAAAPRPAPKGIAAASRGNAGTGWTIYDNPSDVPQPPTPSRKPGGDRSLEPGMNENQVRAANRALEARRAADAPYESIVPADTAAGSGDWASQLMAMIQRGGMNRAGTARR